MAIINNLSEEVLLIIFGFLKSEDLKKCQEVCRKWYTPAHLKMLDVVDLSNILSIRKFVMSLDYNPNPLYFNAVKRIYIDNLDHSGGYTPVSKEFVMKLLGRFPNLKEMEITYSSCILDQFDDDMCEAVLKVSPGLELVYVEEYDDDGVVQNRSLNNVRRLVTKISTESFATEEGLISGFGPIVPFLCNFTRLKSIECSSTPLKNFEGSLPLFERLPLLTEFVLVTSVDDDEKFMEHCLAKKSMSETTLIVEKIRKIKSLELTKFQAVGINSIQFLQKYMTGLKHLKIHSEFFKDQHDEQQKSYVNILLELNDSIDETNFKLKMTQELLEVLLPTFVNKVFKTKEVPLLTNTLHLEVRYSSRLEDMAELKMESNESQLKQRITIKSSNLFDLQKIAEILNQTKSTMDNMDELILTIGNESYTKRGVILHVGIYRDVLSELSSRKVTLDVPANFSDMGLSEDEEWEEQSCVEHLTIRANPDVKIESLLEASYNAFPNLKFLDLFYFVGNWRKSIGEFQIELGMHTLERLMVDITPVKAMMRRTRMQSKYLVLEVELLSTCERLLYQVFLDHVYVVSISDADLRGCVRGEDYYRVHVTVKSLERLVLCMYYGTETGNRTYLHYSFDPVKRATVFNK